MIGRSWRRISSRGSLRRLGEPITTLRPSSPALPCPLPESPAGSLGAAPAASASSPPARQGEDPRREATPATLSAAHPAPLPLRPARSYLAELMEHLLLSSFSFSSLFLVLKKNHFDAKVMHIFRSEVPHAVTPVPGTPLTRAQLPGPIHHDLLLLRGQAATGEPHKRSQLPSGPDPPQTPHRPSRAADAACPTETVLGGV